MQTTFTLLSSLVILKTFSIFCFLAWSFTVSNNKTSKICVSQNFPRVFDATHLLFRCHFYLYVKSECIQVKIKVRLKHFEGFYSSWSPKGDVTRLSPSPHCVCGARCVCVCCESSWGTAPCPACHLPSNKVAKRGGGRKCPGRAAHSWLCVCPPPQKAFVCAEGFMVAGLRETLGL